MPESARMRANLAGCAAMLLWAFLALLSRRAADVPPFELVAMTFAVAAVLGAAVLAARGRLVELRQKPLAWLHGVSGLFGFHALYFMALQLAPAAEANLINYTWPLLIVLLSAVILRLPLGWRRLAGAALGLAGCSLLLGGATAELTARIATGYALAATSALTWAMYSVLARRMSRVPTGAVTGFCAASALLAAGCHVVFETDIAPASWLTVLLLGIGPIGGAFFLWDIGMKRGDPRLLGTLAYGIPVASTLLLCLGGYAAFSLRLVVASVLVAAGGLMASLSGADGVDRQAAERDRVLPAR